MSDLATLQDVESWLKLTPGNSDEPELNALITAASDLVSQYCQVAFVPETDTEMRDGTGGAELFFNRTPVTAVSSVTIDGYTIPTSPGWPTPGYLFTPKRLTLFGYRFTRGLANVSVRYTAGYISVPASIAQATVELVGYMYRERDRIGLRSENVAQQTTSYVITDIPPQIRQKLDPYRRVMPVMT